jgi:hypothetical protein
LKRVGLIINAESFARRKRLIEQRSNLRVHGYQFWRLVCVICGIVLTEGCVGREENAYRQKRSSPDEGELCSSRHRFYDFRRIRILLSVRR